MRNADTILEVIRQRGTQRLPLERVYRLLFNPDLYLRAYMRLYPNTGAMTAGSTDETVDGMSRAKIMAIIAAVRAERYRWTPVRRVRIPKANGKTRPLGLPTWSDKLLQEVIRSLLEAYYDPQFSSCSHGFRPQHGCHTALQTIQQTWTGTRWFIEGDIAQYFDSISHEHLLTILGRDIHDGRFLRLLQELLAAGYLEDWKWHTTLSGTPQGGVLSPLLSNIYLHEFDQWVESTLIPASTRGDRQRSNPAYHKISKQLATMRKQGQTLGVKALIKQRRTLSSHDPTYPGFRRLRYIRYADDFLLGYIGTQAEAVTIKHLIQEWLATHLQLTLSDEKTLITHATTQKARFLGYDIATKHADDWLNKQKRRALNGSIWLGVPGAVVEAHCRRYYKRGTLMHRAELLTESDYTIVSHYQQQYRGIVQYYQLAHNVAWLSKLHWVMNGSLLKTLAGKHKTSVRKEWRRLKTTARDARTGTTHKCIEVRVERPSKRPLTTRFGGISLVRHAQASITDQVPVEQYRRTELLQRFLADECELCGSQNEVEVHHIRKLADLNTKGRKEKPQWVQRMAERQRKTLVVCAECHTAIHAGQLTRHRKAE